LKQDEWDFRLKLKMIFMNSLLYIIAIILLIAWLIGFVAYSAGWVIHLLLLFAVIAILLRLIRGSENQNP